VAKFTGKIYRTCVENAFTAETSKIQLTEGSSKLKAQFQERIHLMRVAELIEEALARMVAD